MEKVLYLIGEGSGLNDSERRTNLARNLGAAGVHGVQVNVADADVAPAAALRITTSATPTEAMVSIWIDSATDHLRGPFDDIITHPVGAEPAAYLVTESVPLTDDQPVGEGERTRGFAQVAFIQRPAGQTVDEWLDLWLNRHTLIALDLQDTFAYVQNVVTRVLTPGATPWHAIVEESFPPAAMTDPHVFYDAVGDDELLARRQREMFESVQRFIDLSRIDVIPTSSYSWT